MNRELLLLLLLAWMTASCAPPPSPVTPAPAALRPNLPAILFTKGEVLLKRPAWKHFSPTSSGTILSADDQLRAAEDAQATILCQNLKVLPVIPGDYVAVPEECPVWEMPESATALGPLLQMRDPTLPYVIRPRRTFLLTSTPHFHWHAAPGADSYTVRLRERGAGIIWETETVTTSLIYPGEPPLETGKQYTLEVLASTGQSSMEEGIPDLAFQVLPAPDAEAVEASAEVLRQLPLSESDKAFALAQLFKSYGLKAEAIELLESQAQSNNRPIRFALTLGELYTEADLPWQAQEAYEAALARSANDVEGVAKAQQGLAAVYVSLQQIQQAIEAYTAARAAYELLGDERAVTQIDAELEKLR